MGISPSTNSLADRSRTDVKLTTYSIKLWRRSATDLGSDDCSTDQCYIAQACCLVIHVVTCKSLLLVPESFCQLAGFLLEDSHGQHDNTKHQ